MNGIEKSTMLRATAAALLAVVVASGVALPRANAGPASAGKEEAARMGEEHLFDVQLLYAGQVECAPLGERYGQFIGGGTGTVNGGRIKGTIVRWSNFERTLGEGLCTLQIPAEVRTDDGADIKFEALGHAVVPDKAQPDRWINAMTVRFKTEDERYRWLNSVIGVWEGEFNMKSGATTAHVYARRS